MWSFRIARTRAHLTPNVHGDVFINSREEERERERERDKLIREENWFSRENQTRSFLNELCALSVSFSQWTWRGPSQGPKTVNRPTSVDVSDAQRAERSSNVISALEILFLPFPKK